MRSVNDHYLSEFDPKNRNRSHEHKITIDVQTVVKSGSKTKSSLNNRMRKENTKN
jgi:hypothetical protein